MIEGGEDFRVQCLSCLDVQRLPLRFDTTEGKESREILCAPLHIETTEGKDSREILCAPLHVETTTEGWPPEVLHASPHEIFKGGGEIRLQRSSCRVAQRLPLLLPLLYSNPAVLDKGGGHVIDGGGEFRLQRSSCRVAQRLPLLPPLLHPETIEEGGGAHRPAPRIPCP